MRIVLLGMNHRSAPLELREQLAVEDPTPLLQKLVRSDEIDEAVLFSTCNRVEIYAATPKTREHLEGVERFLRRWFELEPETELPLYHRRGRETALHLFRVAGGLESMVLGETEIFGQDEQPHLLLLVLEE